MISLFIFLMVATLSVQGGHFEQLTEYETKASLTVHEQTRYFGTSESQLAYLQTKIGTGQPLSHDRLMGISGTPKTLSRTSAQSAPAVSHPILPSEITSESAQNLAFKQVFKQTSFGEVLTHLTTDCIEPRMKLFAASLIASGLTGDYPPCTIEENKDAVAAAILELQSKAFHGSALDGLVEYLRAQECSKDAAALQAFNDDDAEHTSPRFVDQYLKEGDMKAESHLAYLQLATTGAQILAPAGKKVMDGIAQKAKTLAAKEENVHKRRAFSLLQCFASTAAEATDPKVIQLASELSAAGIAAGTVYKSNASGLEKANVSLALAQVATHSVGRVAARKMLTAGKEEAWSNVEIALMLRTKILPLYTSIIYAEQHGLPNSHLEWAGIHKSNRLDALMLLIASIQDSHPSRHLSGALQEYERGTLTCANALRIIREYVGGRDFTILSMDLAELIAISAAIGLE